MPAETLNCPMCGAAASTEAARCEHCGARLATVSCPKCFGMMFIGARFCSHCGAPAERTEVSEKTNEICPRCRVPMESVEVGKTHLEECPQCEGIWVDTASLQKICADTEQQSAVLGLPSATPPPEGQDVEVKIHYVPCPVCRELMNRVNFAHCSQVVVNVCGQHGTWFDKDDLRRTVEFIRGGGMEKARRQEIEELEEKQREARATPPGRPWTGVDPDRIWENDRHMGVFSVVSLLKDLFDV